jgi:hypothetical protein
MRNLKLMLFALFVLAGPVLLFAQAPDPSPSPIPPVVAPDYVELGSKIIMALTVFLVPIVTGLVKKWGPSIPKFLVPIIASGLGVALQALGTLIPGGGKWSILIGLGYAGVGSLIRAILDNLNPPGNASAIDTKAARTF